MDRPRRIPRISINAPVVLGFFALSLLALILSALTGGLTNRLLFSVYRAPLSNPLTYVRFVGHVLGHANVSHFLGNMMLLLVVGPLLEEKYGSMNLLLVMLVTALVTGLVHFLFFPGTQLLGASGVVFALILLSSFTGLQEGRIPLTFLVVAVLYLGQQVYEGLFVHDNVANLTHILGGVIGSVLGRWLNTH